MRKWVFIFCLLWALPLKAHIGSPDIFYEGQIGPYAAQVTIRMPGVVPGRAEITVTLDTAEPLHVAFRPLYSRSAVSNAPPSDIGALVRGEKNRYTGDLWLMASGVYRIDIAVEGKSGRGSVQIPVDSVASRQLPLPRFLGVILALLGGVLFAGGVAIVSAAASESVLPPGVEPAAAQRQKRRRAAVITTVVFLLLLVGGKKWWDSEERDFRTKLIEGGYPDLAAEVVMQGGQRVIQLTLGEKDFGPTTPLKLALDHGKILHLFLVRQPDHDAFAHIHPLRKGNQSFEVLAPPLPEGDYELFCDLTFDSGFSSTATNFVHLPAAPATGSAPAGGLEADDDDSWAIAPAVPDASGPTVYPLADGQKMIWKGHPPLRANQDAALRFEVQDANGKPAVLQPFMGMMSHAAVLREDGRVFAHLHPAGNYSMAAQMLLAARQHEPSPMLQMKRAGSSISIPYQFPAAGQYRVWVQVKSNDRILTGVYDATVSN